MTVMVRFADSDGTSQVYVARIGIDGRFSTLVDVGNVGNVVDAFEVVVKQTPSSKIKCLSFLSGSPLKTKQSR